MKWTRNQDRSGAPIGCSRWPRRRRGPAAVLVIGAFLAGVVMAEPQQAPQSGLQQAAGSAPAHDTASSPVSTPSTMAVLQSLQSGPRNPDAVNADRKKQIANESASLLKLATDLKAEVDKTTKDTLSINVIRKADEIEKLAHSVKEQMKATATPN